MFTKIGEDYLDGKYTPAVAEWTDKSTARFRVTRMELPTRLRKKWLKKIFRSQQVLETMEHSKSPIDG